MDLKIEGSCISDQYSILLLLHQMKIKIFYDRLSCIKTYKRLFKPIIKEPPTTDIDPDNVADKYAVCVKKKQSCNCVNNKNNCVIV